MILARSARVILAGIVFAGIILGGVLLIGVTLPAAGVLTNSRAHVSSPASRKLVFDDEFSGSRLDRRKWSTCYWWANGPCTIVSNAEREVYVRSQVRISGGLASLIAEPRTVRGPGGRTYQFVSGMISSGPSPGSARPKFAFRYGRVEVRMRVPLGQGLWPALWMLPANRSDLPEIDVMEMLGQAPNLVRMYLHSPRPGGSEYDAAATWRMGGAATGWHRFGIDWRPGHLAWLVDGVARWEMTGSLVPSVPMYLIADLAVGGDEAGQPSSRTPFPSALQIDWVRVWQ